MTVTASALRQNIYKTLDRVIATGIPVEIVRRRKRLRIIPVDQKSKLSNLRKRDVLKGDPESLVHMDWSNEWGPGEWKE